MMDQVNATFELAGTLMSLPTLYRAWRIRRVEGVHLATPLFFNAWGLWNVLYYPSLDQWWSFAAGLLLCATNLVWIYTVWRFTPRRLDRG